MNDRPGRGFSRRWRGVTACGLAFIAWGMPLAAGGDAPADAAGQVETGSVPAPPPVSGDEKPHDYPGLHNVVAFAEGFYSGSVPEGDAGFDTLKAWGVRTIISVDGAMPEVGKATSRGMRYVHLPIGYDGFNETRKLELVRAVRDLEKPIYVHCHHGKHRSAGAAGTVAVSLGWLTPEAAIDRMKVSGTSPNYKGLYACTAGAAVLTQAVIDTAPAEFPERSTPTDLVQAMVDIDHATEHLKAIEKAGWIVPKDHPDLVPVAEAGRLADLFRHLIETESKVEPAKPEAYMAFLRTNADRAQAIETLLDTAPSRSLNDGEKSRLKELFTAISADCKACHNAYRD